MKTPIIITALVAVTLSVSACGSSSGSDDQNSGGPDGYDATTLARQIRNEQQTKIPDVKVTDETCPEKPKVAKGATFECTVSIGGVKAPYAVRINSITDSKVNYAFRPAKAIVSIAKAEQFLKDQLAAQNMAGVEVTCPKAPVVVQAPGTTFPCTLAKGGETQRVAIAIKDIDGKIGIAN